MLELRPHATVALDAVQRHVGREQRMGILQMLSADGQTVRGRTLIQKSSRSVASSLSLAVKRLAWALAASVDADVVNIVAKQAALQRRTLRVPGESPTIRAALDAANAEGGMLGSRLCGH